jgi:hypothetical protein
MIKALNRRICDALVSSSIVLALLFVSIFVLLPQGQRIDSYLNPVKKDWVVETQAFDGNDLIISGTLVKARSCTYLPPPRARDNFGNTFLVQSLSAGPGISWVASKHPQKWGPWRVVNGKNKVIEFYMVDKCHFLWDNVTILGSLNAN